MERLKETHLFQAGLKGRGIRTILLRDNLRHTDVGRGLDDLAGSPGGAAMRVGDGVASGIGPRGTRLPRLLDISNDTVLQSHHHRDGLDHRTGLITQHSVVDALDIFIGVVFAALQVTDGLDVTCRHFHKHTGAPLGSSLDAHVIELMLHNILQLDIDRRGNVIALDGRNNLHRSNGIGQLIVMGNTRLAVEQGIKSTLQTRYAMGAGAVKVTDTACRHRAIGLGAARYLLAVEARLVHGFPKKRETAQTFVFPVGQHLREQAIGVVPAWFLALILGVCRIQDGLSVTHQLGTPLCRSHRGVKGSEAIAQRADIFLQRIIHDTVGQPVDACHIEFQIGG